MRATIAGLFWAVILMLQAAPAQAQTPIVEERIGNWTLQAFFDGAFGAGGCQVYTHTGKATALGLTLLANGAGHVQFRDPSWRLPENQVSLAYGIEKHRGLRTQAKVLEGDTAVVALRHDFLWFDQIAGGEVLYLVIQDDVYSFPLAGLAPLVPKLFECVQRYRDEKIAPAPAATTTPPQVDLQAAKAQAALWVERLSAEGAMPRVGSLTSADSADPRARHLVKNGVAAWQNGEAGVSGQLEILPPRPEDVDLMARGLTAFLVRSCEGDYRMTRGGRDDSVIGVYVQCRVNGRPERRDLVLFKNSDGYLYRAAFIGEKADRADDTDLVAEDFRRAALKLLGR